MRKTLPESTSKKKKDNTGTVAKKEVAIYRRYRDLIYRVTK